MAISTYHSYQHHYTPRGAQTVFIRDGIFKIPSNHFANCQQLKQVIRSDDLQIIGKYTFDDCQKLESITMQNKLYTI